jgi:hypothetical protein
MITNARKQVARIIFDPISTSSWPQHESKNHELNQIYWETNPSHTKKLTELQAASPPQSGHSSSQV